MRQPLAAAVFSAIEPGIFHHLLHYIVYGGKVPDCVLKESAREIIIAADKYGVVQRL